MNLQYLKRSEITDKDILDNLAQDTNAILLHVIDDVNWWIEITSDNLYFVNGSTYQTLEDAICAMLNFISDNKDDFDWLPYQDYLPQDVIDLLMLPYDVDRFDKLMTLGFAPIYSLGKELLSLTKMTEQQNKFFELKRFFGESEIMLRNKTTNDLSDWMPMNRETYELLYGLIS